jgi:hypothetical protein
MNLLLDGAPRAFTPIAAYRARHGLPPAFGAAAFQPKDFTGLGSIERAGPALAILRDETLAAAAELARTLHTPHDWLAALPTLHEAFAARLRAANHAVRLREEEIDFAVGGFGDVCHAFVFAWLRASLTAAAAPSFDAVYAGWLNASARVLPDVYPYVHGGETWRVHLVTSAYGRVGLRIRRPEAADDDYVSDPALGCPAEGYMERLLRAVCAVMRNAG